MLVSDQRMPSALLFAIQIAETSLSTQVKLLRFLQDNEIRRIGENSVRKVDVRLLAATNQLLDDKMKKGEFREDLYYRINVIPISVPTLRERKEDIPYLVEHFVGKYRKKDRHSTKSISKRATSILMNYDWPGNVRELENVVERAIALNPANRSSSK